MYLDHTNPDSIEHNVKLTATELRGLKHFARKNGIAELDVRLVSNEDGELWFATGDVQYDTMHGAACEATVIHPDDSDEQIRSAAQDLVSGVADQLAEQEWPMSIRQSKLIRLAAQHDREAHAIDGSDRVVEVAVPYAAYTHTATGLEMPSGVDYERVSTVEELLACLGY